MRHVIAISSLFAALLLATPQAGAQSQVQQPPGAGAMSGNGKFCHTTSTGSMNCTFASLQECNKISSAQGGQCGPNPKASTTGSAPGSDNMKK